MLKLIVFDCDGVMFDSKQSNICYYNDMLRLFGHPPMDSSEEAYSHMATVDGAIEHVFRNYPQNLQEVKNRVKRELNYAKYSEFMRIEPDLIEFLEYARKRYTLAISTNRSDTMLPLLREYHLEHYFQKVVTALTATRPKPAPDGLLEILEEMQCSPEETIFIGDSILDSMQASACGVKLIAFKNEQLEADFHANTFMELCSLPPFCEE